MASRMIRYNAIYLDWAITRYFVTLENWPKLQLGIMLSKRFGQNNGEVLSYPRDLVSITTRYNIINENWEEYLPGIILYPNSLAD